MKTISQIFILLFLSVGLFSPASAQDDKALKKEWAKKMKEMDPLAFKKLVEENEQMKGDIAAKTSTISDLQNNLARTSEDLKKMEGDYTGYRSSVQTATAPSKNETDATAPTSENRERLFKAVVFKVQIGAFKNRDLRKYFENNKNFSGDVDPDGIKKYTLGYFNDYWEAETFKKYLRDMGVKDAWIVPYKNGQRVNIRDVLEGAL